MSSVLMVSNGPSTSLWDESTAGFDVSVGVSKAASRWLFDWWVFSDFQTFLDEKPVGKPRVLTRDRTVAFLALNYPDCVRRLAGFDVSFVGDISIPNPGSPTMRGWPVYSGLMALRLLMLLKRTMPSPMKAILYGFDMEGVGDFTGFDGGSRDDQRWRREREAWGLMQPILRGHGITVERRTDGA